MRTAALPSVTLMTAVAFETAVAVVCAGPVHEGPVREGPVGAGTIRAAEVREEDEVRHEYHGQARDEYHHQAHDLSRLQSIPRDRSHIYHPRVRITRATRRCGHRPRLRHRPII